MSGGAGPAEADSQQEDEEKLTFWHQFTQQRLRAFHPVLAPKVVISIYLVCGGLFSALGVGLLLVSRSVVEYSKDYTDIKIDQSSRVGVFDIEIESDMDPPIWVYYQLDGFHQNHRRYIKSRVDSQMKDADNPEIDQSRLQECQPWVTADHRVNYPCGLIARSVFNDTYLLQVKDSTEDAWSLVDVDSAAKTIAWKADTDGKFRNADPEKRVHDDIENQIHLDMWVNQLFPPVECAQMNTDKAYVPVYVATRNAQDKTGKGQVPVAACRGYMSKGGATCNFTRLGKDFSCDGDYGLKQVKDWGIESGHFIVWMRIAGLPTFRKLWGRIDKPLKKGTTLRVQYADHFPVKEFFGRKGFVISTASVLGGRNDFLGYGYMVVGCCCLVFAAGFLWKHLVNPRQLGDVSLLDGNRQ